MNFITGHNIKNTAHYILDEFGFKQNKSIDNNPIYFVKTDYIHHFFNSSLLPNRSFDLITHNSDYDINHSHANYLEYKFLNKWFAQNVNYEHHKLIPIPIGIANPEWPHGNINILNNIINAKYDKNQLIYANFNTYTNTKARNYCLDNIDKKYFETNIPFHSYLKKIAQSYFNICPLGNGIDSHRIWESLYLKTIPICLKSVELKSFHIYNIDSFSNIDIFNLNTKKYLDTNLHDFNYWRSMIKS
jgi:hypothetical protein